MSKLGGSLVACDAPSPIPSLVCEEQHVEGGGRVLFEHPWAAKSWNDSSLKELFEMDGMRRVRCGQCLFGQTLVDDAGNASLLAKTTGFMTNDENIAEAVERRGFGGHEHIQLLSGGAKACKKYPPRLEAVILCAWRQSKRAAGCGEAQELMGRDRQLTVAAVEAGPSLQELELLAISESPVPKRPRTRAQGGRCQAHRTQNEHVRLLSAQPLLGFGAVSFNLRISEELR